MLKKLLFGPIKYCLFLICLNLSAQTKIYKSDIKSKKKLDSILVAKNIFFLSNSQNQTQINNTHTFTLTDKQLLVFGSNKKKILQLDLETEFPTDNFEPDAYSTIITATAESVWFCYHNYLIHYDFNNNKRLRKINLSKWNPHQVILEKRTIWLISKNDEQLYGLDFEPDERKAYEMEARAKMQAERDRCFPDPKMIEAKRAAEEKFRNKK